MSGSVTVRQSISGNLNENGAVIGSVNSQNSVTGNLSEKSNVDGEVSRPATVYVRELRFGTHYGFPAIGNPDYLYIATDENAQYRFDEETNTYQCVGRDYREIEAIQCQLKE